MRRSASRALHLVIPHSILHRMAHEFAQWQAHSASATDEFQTADTDYSWEELVLAASMLGLDEDTLRAEFLQ